MAVQTWPKRVADWRHHWTRTPGTTTVNERVECAQIYWGVHPMNANEVRTLEVRNPPVHGWSSVLIMRGTTLVDLLHPASLQTFTVSPRAGELRERVCVHTQPREPLDIARRLIDTWQNYRRLRVPFDGDAVSRFILALGGEVPTDAPSDVCGSRLRGGGKEVRVVAPDPTPTPDAETASVESPPSFKPMRRDGKRAQFLLFALEIVAAGRTITVRELMDKFGMTRNNALSYLFQLNKDQGVGYKLSGDAVTLTLPCPIERLLQ